MTVGIRVREETGLQDRVGRWLDTRHQVRRVKSNLLNLREVVLGVLVQEELSDLAELELVLGPDVGHVENVNLLLLPQLLGLLRRHGLDADIPTGVVALLNSLIQILGRVVGRVVGRVFLGDESSALLGLKVQLHVHPLALAVHQLVCVANVAVHLAIAIRDTAVAEENQKLVDGLRVLRSIVPEVGRVVGVGQMCRRVALLCVNLRFRSVAVYRFLVEIWSSQID